MNQPITLKEKLRNGQTVIGGMISNFLRPAMMKIYAQVGFDFAYVENEHCMHDAAILSDSILAGLDNQLPTVIKTPYMDRAECARLLDAGAVGIQLPQTETRQQIDEFCSWTKYPPAGTRMVACATGVNSFRNLRREDLERINEQTMVIAHVETRRGVAHISQIASSPLVDVVFIGQGDLSVSIGMPYQFDHPSHVRAMKQIIEAALSAGKVAGIYAPTLETAKPWLDMGVRFIETADEVSFIRAGASALVDQLRRGAGR